LFTPGESEPAKIRPKPYRIAEYCVTRLRECAIDSALMDTPEAVRDMWHRLVPTAAWYRTEQEAAVCFWLNTRRRCIGFHLMTLGTLDTCLLHVLTVYRLPLIASAAAIVLAHNHPSGDPTPSEGDIKATRDLTRAGNLLKIECLDHVIIGNLQDGRIKDYCSLRELGYFAGM
jgi:DNA repair protein RadC